MFYEMGIQSKEICLIVSLRILLHAVFQAECVVFDQTLTFKVKNPLWSNQKMSIYY